MSIRLLFSILLVLTVTLAGGAAGASADTSTCAFDIFVVDHGASSDVTSSPTACEFNPDWSSNGKRIVYDRLENGSQQLFVADLDAGTTAAVPGAPVGANNGSFSPDGRWLAFDRFFSGDTTIYLVAAQGGTPSPTVADAGDADWSPNSQRLVFSRPSDGSVRTIDLRTGDETIVAPAGFQGCPGFQCGVAWSPDGRYITYSDGLAIWSVHVTPDGEPLGPPSLVTASGPYFQSQPAWTGNGRSIVFTSNRGGDGRDTLWSVSAAGGTPEEIAGIGSTFSYDPAVARGGGAIAYAGSTG